MKLFLKFVLIVLTHKKYINLYKLNNEIAMALANSNLLFHPEEKPFKNWFSKHELNVLTSCNCGCMEYIHDENKKIKLCK